VKEFKFKENFMFGVATASTQIEGGDKNNSWVKWCEEGHIIDSSTCMTACDHWKRVEEDIELLKILNVNTHRMSLEWSRVEPKCGLFSFEAINHYRKEIQLLLDNNITPLITLHHFSDPQWFLDIGGWTKSDNVELFITYVEFVVVNLGDLVSDWITFNEPNVYTNFGYDFGIYPPGIKNIFKGFKVKSEIIKAHVRIYKLIHKIRSDKKFAGETKVGAAIHIRIFDGVTFLGKKIALIVDYFFNELFMEGLIRGKIKFPIPKKNYKYKRGKYVDFIGINYYSRNIVEFALEPASYFYRFRNDENLYKTDLGWDIYPEGIYRACRKYFKKYKLPIYITENGISDKNDKKRPKFILDHLEYISKLIKEGVKIERYYHWTLMDNFEWLDGETANFGLYFCNFENQDRIPRQSVNLYRKICKEKALSENIYDEYNISL
jgi:beta-glucosidase